VNGLCRVEDEVQFSSNRGRHETNYVIDRIHLMQLAPTPVPVAPRTKRSMRVCQTLSLALPARLKKGKGSGYMRLSQGHSKLT